MNNALPGPYLSRRSLLLAAAGYGATRLARPARAASVLFQEVAPAIRSPLCSNSRVNAPLSPLPLLQSAGDGQGFTAHRDKSVWTGNDAGRLGDLLVGIRTNSFGPAWYRIYVQRKCAHVLQSMTGRACEGRSRQIWTNGDIIQHKTFWATSVGILRIFSQILTRADRNQGHPLLRAWLGMMGATRLGAHVVTEERVLFAQIELAVEDDGM